MYSIDNNRLANEKSILSNTNDRYYDQEFDQCETSRLDVPGRKDFRQGVEMNGDWSFHTFFLS